MIKISLVCFAIFSIFCTSLYAKVVLITGASGDIGMGMAKHFADKGDTVLCHYNTNKGVLEELQKIYPNKIFLLKADFNKPETIKAFWDSVIKTHSKIDVVINSAGIEKKDKDLEQIQMTMNVNYLSPRLVCDYAIDHFKDKKQGIIINIGSRAAYRGLPEGYYTYADSKAALTKYSQDIARQNAKLGISVFIVAPGPVEGKMFDGVEPNVKKECLASMPTGKVVTIQEIVDVVDLLSSGKVPSSTGGVFDLMGASYSH